MKLRQQIGLVTGGTKGIGAATAISLATEGADIAIVGRRLGSEAQETRRHIEALSRRCLLIRADVAIAGEATRCVEETIRGLGSVDVLVHCAGGPVNGGLFSTTAPSSFNWGAVFKLTPYGQNSQACNAKSDSAPGLFRPPPSLALRSAP
jgi:NAD(P)-dependent dehydrogenase (short-subunit alcohol dehydrogenase family)